MAVTKIDVAEFVSLSKLYPVIDVRSEGEFQHAHIPATYSLPLFNNEERKIIGTTYKQQSRETAIKIGLDFFGKKMRAMVEEVEKLTEERCKMMEAKSSPQFSNYNPKTILVHCWRGGMRSGAVAWLLDLYGFKVYSLSGGYKAFRNWVLHRFEKDYNIAILGGFTGSGKTYVLNELRNYGEKIIDLEQLAGHKGSAFGNIGLPAQPSQEMFENMLAVQLHEVVSGCGLPIVDNQLPVAGYELDAESEELQTTNYKLQTSSSDELQTANYKQPTSSSQLQTTHHQLQTPIWLEDESQRTGLVNIPNPLWKTMRRKPVYFLDIDFEERLDHIVKEYGKGDKEKLINAIVRIQKRLGGLETKNALNFLVENDVRESFRILLLYYDKQYLKGLNNREVDADIITKIKCEKVNSKENAQQLLQRIKDK